MPEFEFFVSNGPPAPANKTVRSHAMKTALQTRSKTRRGEGSVGAAANSKRTAKYKNELKGRFRLSDTSPKHPNGRAKADLGPKTWQVTAFPSTDKVPLEGQVVPTAVINHIQTNYWPKVEWLGGNLLDPFGSLSIPSNLKIDTLFKHFLVSFDYHTTTVPTHKTWLHVAIQDPLLMRVTLSMTAAFVSMQMPLLYRDLRMEGWKLKIESINEINSLVQAGRVNDNVLGAIAHLAHVASLEGSFEEANIHLQGLQRLIDFRGGITSIKTYQVGRFINWADLELATALGRRPLFHLNYNLDRVNLPQHIIEAGEDPNLSRLRTLGPGHEPVTAVIRLLRQRVMATKFHVDATLRDIRTLWFSAAFLILDHVGNISTTPQEQCLYTLNLAALLFICASMEEDHHWSRSLLSIVAGRLRNSLETGALISAAWANHLPELLWALFVGAATDNFNGQPQGQETWWVSQLAVVQQLLQCDNRRDFERYLHYVVWDDSFGVEFLHGWWLSTGPHV